VPSIDLNSLDSVPPELLTRLRAKERAFATHEFLDDVIKDSEIGALATELNDTCLAIRVLCRHYTRNDRAVILREGLRCLAGDEWREKFLAEHSARFTRNQLDRVKSAWRNYFDSAQQNGRDRRLFFNYTLGALDNRGSESLLAYFGGEAIYWPLKQYEDLAAILRSIGEPLVVTCELDPSELAPASLLDWGKVWLSTFHRSVRSDAYLVDRDAKLRRSVLSHEVLGISSPAEVRLTNAELAAKPR
jgi:hypothetical protein